MNTFIFKDEWLESLSGLPLDIQEKVICEIVRYGTGRPLLYEDDAVVSALVNLVKGSIDYSKEKYEMKVTNGANYGRSKKIDDYAVWKLAHDGCTAAAIASHLGVSKATIDHCRGWKERKSDNFLG